MSPTDFQVSAMTTEGSLWWIEGDFDGDFESDESSDVGFLSFEHSHGTIFRGLITNARRLHPDDPPPNKEPQPIWQSLIPEVYGTIDAPVGAGRTFRFALADAQIFDWTLYANRDGDPTVGPLLGRVKGLVRGRLVATPGSDLAAAPKSSRLPTEVGPGHGGRQEEFGQPLSGSTDGELNSGLTQRDPVAECPVCRFAFGLFAAFVVIGMGLVEGDLGKTAWTTSMLVVPWMLSCLLRQLTPHGKTRISKHRRGLILLLLIGLVWWLQLTFSLTVSCIGLFALPSYLIALIVIGTGKSACWSHGVGLVAWTVYLLAANPLGLNECGLIGQDPQSNSEATELIAQPDAEDSQADGVGTTPAMNEQQTSTYPSAESQNDDSKQLRESTDSTLLVRIDELRERVKSKVDQISRWVNEKADLLAEKVEKDHAPLPDGATRITLEKAVASPKRYFSCLGEDGKAVSRARYTVYLGEGAVFRFNSADLESSAEARLHKLGQLLQASSKKEIMISGHADRSGLTENNETLSMQRSRNVAEWLIRAGYLEPRNVRIIGEGDRMPIVSTDDPEPLNRRVEVKVDCEKKKRRS